MGKARALLLLFALSVPLFPENSFAVDCGSERRTFIRRTGSNLWAAQGIKGRNMIRVVGFGDCTPFTFQMRSSAIHIRGQNNGLDWIEHGWTARVGLGVEGYSVWGVNGTSIIEDDFWGYDCTDATFLNPGHWARFHLYRQLVRTWILSYDDDDNGTYCSTGSFSNVTFTAGLPIGKTAILGPSMSAYDHFDGMFYATLNGNSGWTAFPGNAWYSECIPGYGRRSIAADEWEIRTGYACP